MRVLMIRAIMGRVITEQVLYLSYVMQINVHMVTHTLCLCSFVSIHNSTDK